MATRTHQVFVSHVAFGHARLLLALALNLLELHPHLYITHLVHKQLQPKLIAEKARFALGEEVLSRLHPVFFGEVQKAEGAGLVKVLEMRSFSLQAIKNFGDVYPKLLLGGPLLDTYTNELILAFDVPVTRVVSDMLLLVGIAPTKAGVEAALHISADRKIDIVSFAPLSSAFVGCFFFRSPDSVYPPLFKRALEIFKHPENKREDMEIYEKVTEHNTDLVHVIGAGGVFTYELQPSAARYRSPTDWLELSNKTINAHQDPRLAGVIVVWEGDFTPDVLEASKRTFKNWWEVGPQLPQVGWNSGLGARGGEEFVVEEKKGEVIQFLDRALEEDGERSVLLISFGSVFAIPLLEHVAILLDTLNELKIRFIITQGVLEGEIVEVIESKISASEGGGLLATWVPQNAVLAHKATSFFLTHCGSNSVQESILHEVSMIAWPGAADQVPIAIELSLVHKVAFELLQIRTEFNIGRPTARGITVLGTPKAIRKEMVDVFARMNGSEGEEMRVRIKRMKEIAVASRKEERSRKAMLELRKL